MQEKALKFSKILNIEDIVAPNGWLTRFKARENLDCKNVVKEGGHFDLNVVQNWANNVLPSLLNGYSKTTFTMPMNLGFFIIVNQTNLCILTTSELGEEEEEEENIRVETRTGSLAAYAKQHMHKLRH